MPRGYVSASGQGCPLGHWERGLGESVYCLSLFPVPYSLFPTPYGSNFFGAMMRPERGLSSLVWR